MKNGEVARIAPEVEEAGGLSKFVAAYAGNFSRIVPAHVSVDAFVGLAAAYVHRDPELRRAAQINPASLVAALRECAMLGHVPHRDTFALVPFKSRKAHGGVEVVGIEHYKGVIQRMFRSGGVRSVHALVVRETDLFDPGSYDQPPVHQFDWRATTVARGPLVGVYAWAHLVTGGTAVRVLNQEEVAKYRGLSRAPESFWGPEWPGEGPWTGQMWRKTVLHQLEADVPVSAGFLWEVAAATNGARAWQGVPEMPAGTPPGDPVRDVEDAEVVAEDAGWPPTAQPGGSSAGQ